MSTVFRDAIFWIAVVSCAIAQLFIIRAVVRSAASPSPINPAAARSSSENASNATSDVNDTVRANTSMPVPRRSIEIAWAVLPAALMIAAFLSAWRLMHPGTP